jgi:hypothetical protein
LGENHTIVYAAGGNALVTIAANTGQTINGLATIPLMGYLAQAKLTYVGANVWVAVYDAAAPQAFTPVDASGGGIGAFTAVSCMYQMTGTTCRFWGQFTYPNTANGANASFTLPWVSANSGYANVAFPISYNGAVIAGNITAKVFQNAAQALIVNFNNVTAQTNAVMSLKAISVAMEYPVV